MPDSPDEQKTAYKAAELFSTNRTNKRRNLTSSQWAAVAVEADEIIAAIKARVEEERRKKQSGSLAATHESGDFGVCNNKLLETKDPKPAGLQLSLVRAPSRQHYM